MPKDVDYTLYLVTDASLVPQDKTFLGQIEQALAGGATIVQLREKLALTREFVNQATEVRKLTKKYNVPLIINDRVDVALAVNADGVHVGQDDMEAATVRRQIGDDKILGVSCSNEEEAREVVNSGVADYVGLGTLFPTSTKSVKNVCGPIGIRQMLKVLGNADIQSVAIGGINHANVLSTMRQCQVPGRKLDGVAVVSCIMAALDPSEATSSLKQLVLSGKSHKTSAVAKSADPPSPAGAMVHHITNNVVKNFCANVSLAVGALPIMSELASEFDELAAVKGPLALVVNLGTPTSELMRTFTEGVRAYNKHQKPVVFDPVAAGATQARLAASRELLNAGQFLVIKGNAGEIAALWKLTSAYVVDARNEANEVHMRGVDSVAEFGEEDIISMGYAVASDFQAVVVISGVQNYVISLDNSGEKLVQKIPGGHKLMGLVTGTGCALGSIVAGYAAVAGWENASIFDSVVKAVSFYNVCGEKAGRRSEGPGLFTVNFLDELSAQSVQ